MAIRLFDECACEVEWHTEYAIYRPCLSHVLRGQGEVHIPTPDVPERPDLGNETLEVFIKRAGFPPVPC